MVITTANSKPPLINKSLLDLKNNITVIMIPEDTRSWY